MKLSLVAVVLTTAMGLTQISSPAAAPTVSEGPAIRTALASPLSRPEAAPVAVTKIESTAEPMVVLMRSAHWFVYPHGCDTVRGKLDVVVHFHGAHTTVIPRYLNSGVDAVLVIINKGIGSGAYSDALAIDSQVGNLVERIEQTVADQCQQELAPIGRLALSSWSAGYGGVEQFLRLRPKSVDAVLLADGLHVGFTDKQSRVVNAERLDVFTDFARLASGGKKLMAITHSAIRPMQYAGAGETAQVLSDAAHSPTWPATGKKHGMDQLTASRRGKFYVEGFSGNDKSAHARQLYAIGETSFARLREYWRD